MTAYADGVRFERKTRDHLRDDGYEVTRAAGAPRKEQVLDALSRA